MTSVLYVEYGCTISYKQNINMKTLYDRMVESLSRGGKDFLVEGINVVGKKVYLTTEHDDGIKLVNEPTITKMGNIELISIFRRTPLKLDTGNSVDGNPAIHALKKNYNYELVVDENLISFIKEFIGNTKQIQKEFDVLIVVPSSNHLNKEFMKRLQKYLDFKLVIEDLFVKTSKEEAWDSLKFDKIDSENSEKNANEIKKKISSYFKNMKGDWFQAGKFKDKKLLKYVDTFVSVNNDYSYEDVTNLLTNKKVLILDDTVSSGLTLSYCAEFIIDECGCKDVTCISLFSPIVK